MTIRLIECLCSAKEYIRGKYTDGRYITHPAGKSYLLIAGQTAETLMQNYPGIERGEVTEQMLEVIQWDPTGTGKGVPIAARVIEVEDENSNLQTPNSNGEGHLETSAAAELAETLNTQKTEVQDDTTSEEGEKTDYAGLSHKELVQACRDRGIPADGSKAELIEKLTTK